MASVTAGSTGRCPECGRRVTFKDAGGGDPMWWHDDQLAGIDHEPNGPSWRVRDITPPR